MSIFRSGLEPIPLPSDTFEKIKSVCDSVRVFFKMECNNSNDVDDDQSRHKVYEVFSKQVNLIKDRLVRKTLPWPTRWKELDMFLNLKETQCIPVEELDKLFELISENNLVDFKNKGVEVLEKFESEIDTHLAKQEKKSKSSYSLRGDHQEKTQTSAERRSQSTTTECRARA